MQTNNTKPAYNAKRRIQFLFGFCALVIIVAIAGWYFVAGKISNAANTAIAQQAAAGTEILCDDRGVGGFPFRFGIFCDRIEISKGDQMRITAGAFRSAAVFYNPAKIIFELDGPADLVNSGESVKLNWSSLRASTFVAQPLPEHFSIIGKDFSFEGKDLALSAARVEAHMRIVEKDMDLAGRLELLDYSKAAKEVIDLPPLGADFNLHVEDGVSVATTEPFSVKGTKGTLERAAILLTQDSGLLISGPYSVDAAGLVNAQLNLRIIDVDAVFPVLEKALPDLAQSLAAFANGHPRSGKNGDEIELKINIRNSQVALGFIPLGVLPPL